MNSFNSDSDPHHLLMSLSLAATQFQPTQPRKRTSSFSFPTTAATPHPRPAKAPRTSGMSALRRTESYISLPLTQTTPSSGSVQLPLLQSQDSSPSIPYHRTLRFYKEQRERRKALLNRAIEPITIRTTSFPKLSPIRVHHGQSKAKASPPSTHPLPKPASTRRTSSPLAPSRHVLPGRPVFPRSKPEPDLYRKAITTRMQSSPEGQNILRMGPRLAVSIMTATLELERIVAAQSDRESGESADTQSDSTPSTPVSSHSWVTIPSDDWEMLDCGA